jgi:threonine dehydrogenase-like Zn-dependent dehydrogenase
MRAVGVFPAQKEVRIVEHPEPRITAPDEIKLRVLEVGVCGTDRVLVSFEYGSAPPGSEYFVLGHESLAEVVEVGAEIRGLAAGDLVVPVVRHPCGHCAPCAGGRQDFCATDGYTERGIKDMHGFMTEFVVDREAFVHKVPAALREVAVLVEPLTIAEKAYIQFEAIQQRLPWRKPQHTAVVLGAGPVGLLGAMVLLRAGMRVFVYSRSKPPNPKAKIANALGAPYISSEEAAIRDLTRVTGPIDLVYEAAGGAPVAFELLAALGPNGVFVFTGVPAPEHAARIDSNRLLMPLILRNQVVLGTVNAGPDAFTRAIHDLQAFNETWPRELRALITSRWPLERFREPIFDKTGIKNVIALTI